MTTAAETSTTATRKNTSGYEYDEKFLVWAENVVPLYEEATERQRSATRDIPWDRLRKLPTRTGDEGAVT